MRKATTIETRKIITMTMQLIMIGMSAEAENAMLLYKPIIQSME